MRKFFEPADAPQWLKSVLSSIRAAMGDPWSTPLRLQSFATADLPAAADYTGGLAWNSTASILTWSNGSAWAQPALAGAVVTSFNTRVGAVTLTSADVTGALTYTPTSVTGLTGVKSVAAFKTGLSLVKADVGLGSVDNTADAAKNVLSAATLTTSRNIDGQAFNGSANITVIAPGTHAATTKATPVDADELPLVDSAASNVLAKLTWANLKATLKTYLDTLYQPLAAALTSWAAVTRASGFDTFAATATSANLRALLSDETGTGAAVFAGAPTFTGTVAAAAINASDRIDAGNVISVNGSSGFSAGARLHLYYSGGSFISSYNTTTATYGQLTLNASSMLLQNSGAALASYANDAAAAVGGVPVQGIYRNGSVLMVRVV